MVHVVKPLCHHRLSRRQADVHARVSHLHALQSAARRLIPLLDRVLVRLTPLLLLRSMQALMDAVHLHACVPLQVKRIEAPTKSIGGILLPESTQSKLNEGVVISVGPGKRDKDGSLLPMGVKVDDKVLLPQYGGSEVTIDDEDLVLFRDDDIMGVLKD